MIHFQDISYSPDNSAIFDRIRKLPYALWLDSQGAGRHELLMAAPRLFCRWSAGSPTWSNPPPVGLSAAPDPFAAARLLQELWGGPESLTDSPFTGGIAGYWAYDAGGDGHVWPEAAWGWYDWFIVVDHSRQRSRLVFRDDCPAPQREAVLACLAGPPAPEPPFRLLGPFTPGTPEARYAADIGRIRDYILAGDCYQVNYAQSFAADYTGSPWSAWQALRQQSRSPWAAALSFGFADILCLSPEQFLEVRQGIIRSKPIKGTRPRFPDDPARDAAEAAALLASAKDRAENVMITDLLRNDIGRHAETGSVAVEKLCDLESFSLVHHLVSTVTARLRPGSHPFDLLRDAFPGGSITGAPKRRAMEIIRELEPVPRSIYCGSIGYLGADGSVDMNIAIRTLVCANGRIQTWAGGGITADSVWEDEYQECFNKIGGILRTLEAL